MKIFLIMVVIVVGILMIIGACVAPQEQDTPRFAPVLPTPVPTLSFAPGHTEDQVIQDAAICRMLQKGYSVDELRLNPGLIKMEERRVIEDYTEGRIGLAALHELTEQLCR